MRLAEAQRECLNASRIFVQEIPEIGRGEVRCRDRENMVIFTREFRAEWIGQVH